MANVELIDVTVTRAGRMLLDAVDLRIPHGERVAVLGASGAGKTTLLRTIVGAVPLDRGAILLDGVEMTDTPPHERRVAMVAQAAALLPHRDVAGNIGFPLEIRHVPRGELDRRVRAQARTFSLGSLLGRRSSVLSAGQTAEVALARSFVSEPTLVLLDEPFARIDTHGRASLMREVIRVQEEGDLTLLIATNDPRVASTIATTTVVLEAGRVVQVGSVRELREHPASTYVAGLASDGPMNLLPANLVREHGRTMLRLGTLRIPTWQLALTDHGPGPVQVAVRPTDLGLDTELEHPADASHPQVRGHVVRRAFLGDTFDVTVATEDNQITVRCPRPAPGIGATVTVSIPLRRLHVFDPAGNVVSHGV